MLEKQYNQEHSSEQLSTSKIGHETVKVLAINERNLRGKRDVALNTFRQGKLFGSFNSQYSHLRELCMDSDAKYDNTYSAYEDYLQRLKEAGKNGTPLKNVKKPTLALADTKVGNFAGKVMKKTGYLATKVISWMSPIVMISDIAGELWDKEEFAEVRKMTEATEKQRERVMVKLDSEIAAESRQVQSKDEATADKKAELKAQKKDQELASQIRENLGIKNLSANDNSEELAA